MKERSTRRIERDPNKKNEWAKLAKQINIFKRQKEMKNRKITKNGTEERIIKRKDRKRCKA